MGFPLFTERVQGIRLIMDNCHKNFDYAADIKKKGGIPIECMRDFAVDGHLVYSFAKLTTFISYQHVSIALSHTAKASEPIFNALTGLKQKVANYPGVTVEKKEGYCFFKSNPDRIATSDEMIDIWAGWCDKYPIRSIEDGLAENDWTSWKLITELELEWKKRKGCV
jgi:hypothetical protein